MLQQPIPVNRERLVIELTLNSGEHVTQDSVKNYLVELSEALTMTIVMGPICHSWAKDHKPQQYDGFEALLVWAESGTQLYYWEKEKFLTIDIYTCKSFSITKALEVTRNYFDVNELAYQVIPHVLEVNPNNSPKVTIGNTSKGKGVIVLETIEKDELITVFDGEVYFAEKESLLPEIAANTACPFHTFWYRDGKPSSYSRRLNHSCEPNCGIKNLFEVVAMRTIQPGEEVTFDYGMICNSDWENPEGKCLCGSPSCRGKILPYRDLSQSVKDGYKGYISEWLEK